MTLNETNAIKYLNRGGRLILEGQKQNFEQLSPNLHTYSYNTNNCMHLFLKLFFLAKRSTCFGRSFRPSLGTSGDEMELRSISSPLAAAVWLMLVAVCAVLSY